MCGYLKFRSAGVAARLTDKKCEAREYVKIDDGLGDERDTRQRSEELGHTTADIKNLQRGCFQT